MFFLESRKKHSASGAANLVTCGGNGIVRFWNTVNASLVGEFCAHQQGTGNLYSNKNMKHNKSK